MGNNLPPMDPRHRRNAPWNQDHPEPDGICPRCEIEYVNESVHRQEVYPDPVTIITEWKCPTCKEVMRATRYDATQDYLEAWSSYPEEMMTTIKRFSELKQYGN